MFNFCKTPYIENSVPALSLQPRSRRYCHEQTGSVCERSHGEILQLCPAENAARGNDRPSSDPGFPNFMPSSGPETIKNSRAWIGAQLTILCSINRKLRNGDYKEIGVRFLCSV